MKLYRVVIQAVFSFASPLQSDTLFGAFCWSYRYCYGEDKLIKFLNQLEENPTIFSNAFPAGTLPVPVGVYDSETDFNKLEDKEKLKNAYQERKKLKKARFVKREWFEKIQVGNCKGFTAGLTKDGWKEQSVMHNMVSREAGTVQNIDGSGNLYEETEFFVESGTKYDIYILSALELETLKRVVHLMFLLGIGKNKSTGKGTFDVIEWKEDEDLLMNGVENANAFVALSNFIPKKDDPIKGKYKTLVKYGKLDREYAMSDTPFKKPILFFQAGAVFQDEDVKSHSYYGRILKSVAVKPEVIVNAYTIAVPIRVQEE